MYSFDVFDTLITRYTATPGGIFAIMQKRLHDEEYSDIPEYVKENFCLLREGIEKIARKTYAVDGMEDVTLEQIYEISVLESLVTKEQAIRLADLEIHTEISHVCGIPENIARVKALLSKGEKVILISDMYQSREVIRKMLVKADAIFEKLPLYVSSDNEKKGKWTGNLFPLIQEKENVSYDEWIHIGDNKNSDVTKPRQFGIICEPYEPVSLLDIEKTYLANHEWDCQAQLMIGCARVAVILGNKNTAFELGCSIGGIVLYPYIDWLLKDAVKRSVDSLYFIARDGFILKEIADVIIAKRKYPIKTKYIYGSRAAWRIPDLKNLKEDIWNIYIHSYQDRIFNCRDLADFFGLREEELICYLPEKVKQEKAVFTTRITDFLVKRLLNIEDFMEKLKTCYSEKKECLLMYLRQEIDFSGENFAFVDLAGSGLTQDCLGKVMKELYDGKIQNYFFRKDKEQTKICDNRVFYPCFFPYFVLLEMMCRAPHGQTMGYYKASDDSIKVVFSDVDEQAIKEHGVPEFIEGAKAFAGIFNDVMMNTGKEVTLKNHMILPYMEYIFKTPDQSVSDYFGDIPNMLTGRERVMARYAPRLTDDDIRNIFWYRDKEAFEYHYTGSDINYSVLRCTDEQKEKIRRYKEKRNTSYAKICRTMHRLFSKRNETIEVLDSVYDFIEQRIVIYGAGKVGQSFYERITGKVKVGKKRYQSDVVLWLDENMASKSVKGMTISSPDAVRDVSFEQLIIAIKSKEIAEQVRSDLIHKNVPDWKILWLYEF